MLRPWWIVPLVALAACARRPAPAPAESTSVASGAPSLARSAPRAPEGSAPGCFDVVVRSNSVATTQVFDAKGCQGGGVTWAALLRVLVDRRGASRAIDDEPADWTGEVRAVVWHGAEVRFAIDEEGDAARFCTDSTALRDEVRRDVATLNADASALRRAMAEADPEALECFPPSGATHGASRGDRR